VLRDRVARVEGGVLQTARGFVALLNHGLDPVSGAAVALTVRPEKVSLSLTTGRAKGRVNSVGGVIESVVFLGESTTYLIRVDDGLFRVKQFQDADHGEFVSGAAVTLEWNPHDTSAFLTDDNSDVF
jgi:ABC-type Fe3+/spermidine/putrescine transport system ATPase subunit